MVILVMELHLIKNQALPSGGFGQNALIFEVDMSSSTHIDNKKKDMLVLGKGPILVIRTYFNCRKNVFD